MNSKFVVRVHKDTFGPFPMTDAGAFIKTLPVEQQSKAVVFRAPDPSAKTSAQKLAQAAKEISEKSDLVEKIARFTHERVEIEIISKYGTLLASIEENARIRHARSKTRPSDRGKMPQTDFHLLYARAVKKFGAAGHTGYVRGLLAFPVFMRQKDTPGVLSADSLLNESLEAFHGYFETWWHMNQPLEQTIAQRLKDTGRLSVQALDRAKRRAYADLVLKDPEPRGNGDDFLDMIVADATERGNITAPVPVPQPMPVSQAMHWNDSDPQHAAGMIVQ